jgi:hypothetical protein
MKSETGESSRAIAKRGDDHVWPRIEAALRGGATLYRPVKLTKYFTETADDRDPNNGIGMTAARVRKLEAEGILHRVGVERYAMTEAALANATPETASQ